MRALVTGDADAFYAAETEARREAEAPPFGRYAAIIVSSEDQPAALETARAGIYALDRLAAGESVPAITPVTDDNCSPGGRVPASSVQA